MESFFAAQQLQGELEKIAPLRFSGIFPQTVGNILVQILHAYYTFLSTIDYKILFSYLQL